MLGIGRDGMEILALEKKSREEETRRWDEVKRKYRYKDNT